MRALGVEWRLVVERSGAARSGDDVHDQGPEEDPGPDEQAEEDHRAEGHLSEADAQSRRSYVPSARPAASRARARAAGMKTTSYPRLHASCGTRLLSERRSPPRAVQRSSAFPSRR
jgi:hypothetical protein